MMSEELAEIATELAFARQRIETLEYEVESLIEELAIERELRASSTPNLLTIYYQHNI